MGGGYSGGDGCGGGECEDGLKETLAENAGEREAQDHRVNY